MVRRPLARAGLVLAAAALWPVSPAIAQPPTASFSWYPPSPHPGEVVSLASTSTDASSPLTAWAWDFTGGGAFQDVGPVTSTTFSAPGNYGVRLLVTAADGTSSVASETIPVSSQPPTEMLPFPIVRIVGAVSRAGMKLRLLSVETPPGAQINVACVGRGCPIKSLWEVANSTGVESVTVRLRPFERFLRAGVTLEIRVSKAGEIGKYTRLEIRHRRPPARLDECLDSATLRPMTCPLTAGE
jgi:PKD domain